jgi:hypothetical protein
MMGEPVFVIHGVANHDRDTFAATVDRLQRADPRWRLVPVFWGDLGANDQWLDLTLPRAATARDDLRDKQVRQDDSLRETLGWALIGDPQSGPSAMDGLRDGQVPISVGQLAATDAGVQRRFATIEGDLRDGGSALADEIVNAITVHWQRMRWLPLVTDPHLLREVGSTVAGAVIEQRTTADTELRGPDVGAFVARRLHDVDALVGAVVGTVAGRLNFFARSAAAPGLARFFGDVLVYQRHREEIHQRVRETIRTHGADLGTMHRPVPVLAHSLGGVIVLDLTVSEDALWVSHLVTFGSQFSFFHAIDPRGGLLAPLSAGVPAALPESLGRWTNLWESMDLLAFLAGRVFKLHNGSPPLDIEVPHLATSGLWTHSAYWHLPCLTGAMARAFLD